MSHADSFDDPVSLPRSIVRLPIELVQPEGFDPERPETWPNVDGRLEFVDGRLQYMPPCADDQYETVGDVHVTIANWARAHRGFIHATNEAGMLLRGAVRAADVAVWRTEDHGPNTGRLAGTPPLLAVEVSGQNEDEDVLRDKARWYLDAGVRIVWLVLVESREVLVLTRDGERRFRAGERLAEAPELPGLAPMVDELFVQISR